jgi:hypothetical protein
VSEADGSAIAEIWVTDRVQQKTVIERAQLGHGNPNRESEILAVRAVELLKADLVELWGPPASPQPPAASASASPPPANATPKNAREAVTPGAPEAVKRDEEAKESDEPPAPSRPRAAFASGLGIGLGAGMTESFGAVGEAWAPTALVSYGRSGGFGVRATFSGFGPSLTLRADAGTAQIEQQFATLELVEALWPTAPVVPFVCAGAGGLHVHVDGTGFGVNRGNISDSWSVISSAGLGAGIPLFPQLSFVAQARGLLAWPANAVQIASAEVGRIGGPSLRLDAGLLGVFR